MALRRIILIERRSIFFVDNIIKFTYSAFYFHNFHNTTNKILDEKQAPWKLHIIGNMKRNMSYIELEFYGQPDM